MGKCFMKYYFLYSKKKKILINIKLIVFLCLFSMISCNNKNTNNENVKVTWEIYESFVKIIDNNFWKIYVNGELNINNYKHNNLWFFDFIKTNDFFLYGYNIFSDSIEFKYSINSKENEWYGSGSYSTQYPVFIRIGIGESFKKHFTLERVYNGNIETSIEKIIINFFFLTENIIADDNYSYLKLRTKDKILDYQIIIETEMISGRK